MANSTASAKIALRPCGIAGLDSLQVLFINARRMIQRSKRHTVPPRLPLARPTPLAARKRSVPRTARRERPIVRPPTPRVKLFDSTPSDPTSADNQRARAVPRDPGLNSRSAGKEARKGARNRRRKGGTGGQAAGTDSLLI